MAKSRSNDEKREPFIGPIEEKPKKDGGFAGFIRSGLAARESVGKVKQNLFKKVVKAVLGSGS